MADKSTQLILDALTRAAAQPAGQSLFAHKAEPGLFPSTTLARTAADRAKSDGLLKVIENGSNGRGAREMCILTEKGLRFLTQHSNPRQLLEDLIRVLEERQSAVGALTAAVAKMSSEIVSLRAVVEQIAPRLIGPSTNGATVNGIITHSRPLVTAAPDMLIAEVRERLAEWHVASETSQDCPLPDLYRRLTSMEKVSVGQFHDALRQLHDDHQIYLHPWTGPLYALPEPAFALLVGHGVAYYASIR